VLVTFHPETISQKKISSTVNELLKSLDVIRKNYQIIITMPNADTMGNTVRKELKKFISKNKNAFALIIWNSRIFSCMKHCSFLLGNTSAELLRRLIRKIRHQYWKPQQGRTSGKNVLHCEITKRKFWTQ